MNPDRYLAAQHASESLTTGQFVAGLVMLVGALTLAKLLPARQDELDRHHALRLNRGRRATDQEATR